jgi:hypothetical protein
MELIVTGIIVIAAVAAVIVPLVRRTPAEPLEPAEPAPVDDAVLETEILRYRGALRDGTLCRRCGEANPGGSRFCANCGRALTAA